MDDVYYSEFKNKSWKFAATMFAGMPMLEFEHTNHVQILTGDNFYSLFKDPELVDCFLALSDDESYLSLPFENVRESQLNLQHSVCLG